MKLKRILVLPLLFIAGISNAQTHGTISVEIGVPINEFHDKLKDVSGGGKFALYFPLRKTPNIFLGGGLGFGTFGGKSQKVHEVLDVYMGPTLIDQIPIDFRVTTNNNFFNGHFSVRFKHPGNVIQPYGELRIGFNNFYTHTTVYDETYNRMFTYDQNDNKIEKSAQLNSLTYSVGGEGGFIFKFGRCWAANIGVAYLLGGEARYYSKSQISQWTIDYSGSSQDWNANNIDPETVNLNPSAVPLKSTTDMLLCTAGITFGLCPKTKAVRTPETTKARKTSSKSSSSNNYIPPPKPPKQPKPKVPIPQVNPNGNGTPAPTSPPPPKNNK